MVDLKPKPHETFRRAMNAGFWDEMQDRAEEPPASNPPMPSAPKANGNGHVSQNLPSPEDHRAPRAPADVDTVGEVLQAPGQLADCGGSR